jgi:hypothetical protein
MIDDSKITIPQEETAKYTFTRPPNNIVFYNNFGDKQVEVLRITKDGITANPDVPVDEAADAVIRALDRYIKNLVGRKWVGLTDVEWMNIVNKDQAWFGQRPDEVAHEVAKMVEARLKDKNNG